MTFLRRSVVIPVHCPQVTSWRGDEMKGRTYNNTALCLQPCPRRCCDQRKAGRAPEQRIT